MASDGRQAAGPKKRKPSSSAALFSRTEPGGEHLAVPAPEPPRQPCLRELRRHRRRMLRRMECPRCRTGSHHLHHDTTLGIGHNLMPLVHAETRADSLSPAVAISNKTCNARTPYGLAMSPIIAAASASAASPFGSFLTSFIGFPLRR